MKIHGWRWLLVACALFSAARTVAQEARDPERTARLVRDLGADSFRTREAAKQELAALGTACRDQLRLAAAAADPEVRLRAQELLQQMALQELWRASPIRIQSQKQPVSQLLSQLTTQSGNRISTGTRYEVYRDVAVSLDFDGVGYWQVLDELCRQSGNHIRPHYDIRERGVVLAAGPMGQNPVAYSGPLRVELISARRVYDDELTYKSRDLKRLHSFRLVMTVLWEDRFRLTAYRAQPKVITARTDSGETLLSTESSYEWNVAGPGVRQLTLELKLQPPSLAARRLESLLLEWDLLAVDDAAELVLESLTAGESKCQDGMEVHVESCQSKAESLHEVVLATDRERLLPDPPESVFQENSYELLDDMGTAWPLADQAHELRGELIRSRLVFRRESGGADRIPKVLKVKYPRMRSQRALEILFRDIPLPAAIS